MNTVFASRWKALWWAAGILMTAYCSVPSPDETDIAAPPVHPAARNPWAKNPGPATKPAPQTPDFADDQGLRDLETLTHKLP